jgi:TolB-like protein
VGNRVSVAGIRGACCCLAALVILTVTVQGVQRAVDAVRPTLNQTVCVRAFDNLSRVQADQWIGSGIRETLASDLQTVYGIEVMEGFGRTLTDGTDDGVTLGICRELGAVWLIAGGYQREGDRVRITTRLVAVETGVVSHAFTVDGTVGELFVLQDRIVEALGRQFGTTSQRARVGDAVAGSADQLAPQAELVAAATATGTPLLDSRSEIPTLVVNGPLLPVPPEVISRDARGLATIRAVRLATPLELDGRLVEDVYTSVPSMSDFIQQEPQEGTVATEKTEVWVFFDTNHVYVSFRCWESDPTQMIANEMRRDNGGVFRNANVAFVLDTFYDRRNGVEFMVNPIGGRMDGQITDERMYNGDWNPIWDVEVGRFEGGWTVEAAIPFKSLRYRPGQVQVWGFNARRINAWKNEHSFLMQVPSAKGGAGIFQMSRAATLVGLEVPTRSRSLDIKPYAITNLTSDGSVTPQLSNDVGGDVGLDVKYGVTQNLVADLSVNTDFAQVEADEQQINLTRFSLFFPEKREFFLENQGIFAFGGARNVGARGGGTDTPVLFYSREIGLDRGQVVPMDVGGRLTGRIGRFSVGLMNVQTGGNVGVEAQRTHFTVARVRRDILRRSNVGALFTGRSVSKSGAGSSETYGVDGIFSFYDNLNINTYWSKTKTPAQRGDDVSYRAQLDYNGDRYGVEAERLVVGGGFNPEVGFLRRDDFDRRFGLFRFSPRPEWIDAVRKFTFEGHVAYVLDRAGVLETRENRGQFGIDFENSDKFTMTTTRSYERLDQPFGIATGVAIPVGAYTFADTQASFTLGQQRVLAGNVSLQHGSFFGGNKTTVGFSRGRMELTPQLSVEPSVSHNRVELPEGRFITNLVTARTTYSVTPLMFVSALLQYNSSRHALSTNVRFRWEYQPGSELFVVYNEQRDTLIAPPRFTELENRALIIKLNRLFRF